MRRLWGWFWSLWRSNQENTRDAPKVKRKRKAPDYVDGNYTTMRHLLRDLDYWFGALRKFKTSHLDADRLVKSLGTYIPGPMEFYECDKLCGGSDRPMPMYFSTTFYSARLREMYESDDKVPIFAYASKVIWDNSCQMVRRPESGWFYDFYVCYYLEGKWYRGNTFVEICGDSVRLLPHLKTQFVDLPKNRAGRRGYHSTSWAVSTLPWRDSTSTPVEDTVGVFISTYNVYLRRGCSTEVHATKGGIRLVFSVPEHRWKDFFKDRITAKASDGKRKRIFHHVSSHVRKNGAVIPMHTRGETEFEWGPANIRIVEQKKGRVSVLDCEIGTHSSDDLTLPVGAMGVTQASQAILQHTLKRIHRQRTGRNAA